MIKVTETVRVIVKHYVKEYGYSVDIGFEVNATTGTLVLTEAYDPETKNETALSYDDALADRIKRVNTKLGINIDYNTYLKLSTKAKLELSRYFVTLKSEVMD